MSSPEVQAAKRTAPREDKYYQLDATTTQASVLYTTLATALDLSKPLRFEAAGGDVTIVCGRAGKTLVVGTTSDSASNRPGSKITNGTAEEY